MSAVCMGLAAERGVGTWNPACMFEGMPFTQTCMITVLALKVICWVGVNMPLVSNCRRHHETRSPKSVDCG